MKTSDYLNACKAIHVELAEIAERTRAMAWAQDANPCNPAWASLMARQEELLEQLAALDRTPLEP